MSAHVKQLKCSKCNESRLDEFYRLTDCWCKNCTREYNRVRWASGTDRLRTAWNSTTKKDKKGEVTTLTWEDVLDIWTEQAGMCFYLHIPMDRYASSPSTVSIDRIDNTKGYAPDNVVLATKFANLGRSTTEFNTFIAFIKENIQ